MKTVVLRAPAVQRYIRRCSCLEGARFELPQDRDHHGVVVDHHVRDLDTGAVHLLRSGLEGRAGIRARSGRRRDDADRVRGTPRDDPHHRQHRDRGGAVSDPQAGERSRGTRLRHGPRDGVRVHRGRSRVHVGHLDAPTGRAERLGRGHRSRTRSGVRVVLPARTGLRRRRRERIDLGWLMYTSQFVPRPVHLRPHRWPADHHLRCPRHVRRHRGRGVGPRPHVDPGGVLGVVARHLPHREGVQAHPVHIGVGVADNRFV